MSLLPEQIPPPNQPLGTWTMPDGSRVPVLIDKNFWLFLYNLASKVLGTSGGLTADALQILESIDIDALNADAAVLRAPISNATLFALDPPPDPPIPSPTLPFMLAEDTVPIGSLPETNGGTGQTQFAIGDLLYSAVANKLARLTGNTTTTKKFLTQTGTGSASQAPGWNTIAPADYFTSTGTTAAVASGTPTTLFTAPGSGWAAYIVMATISSSNDVANYGAVYLVTMVGSALAATAIHSAALMTITISGLNVQATQSSGASNPINFTVMRVG